MTKINNIATILINGEIEEFKDNLKRLKPNELLNLILEYSLLKGVPIETALFEIRRFI